MTTTATEVTDKYEVTDRDIALHGLETDIERYWKVATDYYESEEPGGDAERHREVATEYYELRARLESWVWSLDLPPETAQAIISGDCDDLHSKGFWGWFCDEIPYITEAGFRGKDNYSRGREVQYLAWQHLVDAEIMRLHDEEDTP